MNDPRKIYTLRGHEIVIFALCLWLGPTTLLADIWIQAKEQAAPLNYSFVKSLILMINNKLGIIEIWDSKDFLKISLGA